MALDTMTVPLASGLAAEYLRTCDERGDSMFFDMHSIQSVGRGKVGPVRLELMRDGAADALNIVLHMDGTWTATHAIIIGEKH